MQQPIDNDPLRKEPWYFGNISRETAEQKLARFRGTVSYYFPQQTFHHPAPIALTFTISWIYFAHQFSFLLISLLPFYFNAVC